MTARSTRRLTVAAVSFAALSFVACSAMAADGQAAAPATATAPAPAPAFTYQEVMVPVRDGVKLQTVIIAPAGAHEKLPILFSRSPYGVPPAAPPALPPSYSELAKDGYILVFQNLRGRFKSEGVFQISTKSAPMAAPCIGSSCEGRPSDSLTDLPFASWPVTTRRACVAIRLLRSRGFGAR